MSLVKIDGLLKRYTPSAENAVDGISFEIWPGEIFSLLGPNGAGKTTTISMLSTLIAPTEGDALVCGHSVSREAMAVRRKIGIVPQEIALYEELSARENLRFWGEMRGLSGKALKNEIELKLERIGLAERAKDRVKTFSGGMKRRLNIAIGLLGDPELVMLDEPAVGIDPQSRRYILDWVKELNQQGLTILYTTHYMEEAQELSHRVGIMDHGRLIALGTLEELTRLVGEHETLYLHIDSKEDVTKLAQALQDVSGVLQVSAADGKLVLNTPSANDTLPLALAQANRLGLSVRTIEIQEPNLEAVFLHLTGRALRD